MNGCGEKNDRAKHKRMETQKKRNEGRWNVIAKRKQWRVRQARRGTEKRPRPKANIKQK